MVTLKKPGGPLRGGGQDLKALGVGGGVHIGNQPSVTKGTRRIWLLNQRFQGVFNFSKVIPSPPLLSLTFVSREANEGVVVRQCDGKGVVVE